VAGGVAAPRVALALAAAGGVAAVPVLAVAAAAVPVAAARGVTARVATVLSAATSASGRNITPAAALIALWLHSGRI